jgi:phosphoribosyl-ATP pyrophosphohydrolase/phosphoribosyl-AMP cyclohydrolase
MTINYDKQTGLVPAIIQDSETKTVLMLGYMNEEALAKTELERRVTFFSRSKQRLWTKGEESGNFLDVTDIKNDCDSDALLIRVRPHGPTCHTGSDTCWNEENKLELGFLGQLEGIIQDRQENPEPSSYTSSLFAKGINKMAQKVGEEAVELVIEAKDNDDRLFLNEAADLLFHYLILLRAKGFGLNHVIKVLKARHL